LIDPPIFICYSKGVVARQGYSVFKPLKERRHDVTKKIHTFSCFFGKS